ncbi:secreted RxLR effector protein 161-like [Vicia villosa]|uniref:secreted RxLR effector protein 161-like n=1 Tax=Vicia villosa TaxID=3911 RepID=UPI00273B15AE|nr:secreted RxLR effector protein 161-like [Vicia villosa]
MTDLGRMKYFLGIEVLQLDNGIFICQRNYVKELLIKFRMEESNTVLNPIVPKYKMHKDEEGVKVNTTLYMRLMGSMMYVTTTQPDVRYVVSLISIYMSMPTELHFAAVKRILRYLQGTLNMVSFIRQGGNRELVGFTDSNYAGCVEDRKSTSGYTFILSDVAVAWSSKKQPIVTLSITEADGSCNTPYLS